MCLGPCPPFEENEPEYNIVLLRDESSGLESCDTEAPGSDIWAVELSSSEGTTRGWGNLVVSQLDEEDNAYTLGVNFNGKAPDATTTCPERTPDTVTSLGCGGQIALQFQESGIPVQVLDGDMITVYEWGAPRCEEAQNGDLYSARLCSNSSAVLDSEDFESCSLELGSGLSGVETRIVALPERTR